jgi:hypothetical protein
MISLDEKSKKIYKKLVSGDQNPLDAKTGEIFVFPQEEDFKNIGMVLNSVSVCHSADEIQYIDYHLIGTCLALQTEHQLRLRVQKHIEHEFAAQAMLLQVFQQKICESEFETKANDSTGEYLLDCDEYGTKLHEPRKYWKLNKTDPVALTAYSTVKTNKNSLQLAIADVSTLKQWNFGRKTTDHKGLEYLDFLFLELDTQTKKLSILRGLNIPFHQIVHMSAPLT